MKLALLFCLLLATVTAIATAMPHQRFQRDVSELPAYGYLPPKLKYALRNQGAVSKAEAHAHAEADADADDEADALIDPEVAPISAALGGDGYEYRTLRRLKFRQRTRRDVSHLSPAYLPPSQAYLPPNVDADDSDVVNTAEPKVALDFLPPTAEEVSTPVPIVVPEEGGTETPTVQEEEPTLPQVRTQEEEAIQNSAVLFDDGYHYRQPVEEMPLAKAAESEYLPPLEQDQSEAEGPEESAVLAADGYHYRAIKRLI